MALQATIDYGGARTNLLGAMRPVAEVITISASEPESALEAFLAERLARWRAEHGVEVQVNVQRTGHRAVLHFACSDRSSGDGTDLHPNGWRRLLAEALADFVVERMEPALLERLLRQGYGHVGEDRGRVLAAAHRQLRGNDAAPIPSPGARKAYVREHIQTYLAEDDILHLDGLLTFRMGDYLEDLERALDRAVEDVLMEREYREFVSLLRYFVELQEPRIELVHVMLNACGGFRLIDDEGRSVAQDDLAAVEVELGDLGLDAGDVIISALVAVAPLQVLLHDPHAVCARDVVETLRSVFPRRLYTCGGCSLCDQGRRAR